MTKYKCWESFEDYQDWLEFESPKPVVVEDAWNPAVAASEAARTWEQWRARDCDPIPDSFTALVEDEDGNFFDVPIWVEFHPVYFTGSMERREIAPKGCENQ